jgi:hypothetical protein
VLVRRQIRLLAAHLRRVQAQDAFERAHEEKEAAGRHLQKVIERSDGGPARSDWVIDPAHGVIREPPFDERKALLDLAFQITDMDPSERSVVADYEGELLPDGMKKRLDRIEEEAPNWDAREFLIDLAVTLEHVDAPGRQAIASLRDRPDVARSVAQDDSLPAPIRFLAHLCVSTSSSLSPR